MGTINYGTSKYITMGFETLTAWDIEQDKRLFAELEKEAETYGGDIDEYIYTYIQDCEESDYENIDYILQSHSFDYFNITLECGYYDGCYLKIDDGRDIWDDDDKCDALKEVEEVRAFLHECNGSGMRACYPHWCTTFDDYEKTKEEIEKACDAMRADIMAIDTSEDGTA